MKTLLEELYTQNECKVIKDMFSNDTEETKRLIINAIGTKISLDKEKILLSNPLDIIYMICLTADFANSEEECHNVAVIVHYYFNKPQKVLPMISEDFGVVFAKKALVSLSFYPEALEHRWKYHGAPKPDFYRKISKATFINNEMPDIAAHHEQWESFLRKTLI